MRSDKKIINNDDFYDRLIYGIFFLLLLGFFVGCRCNLNSSSMFGVARDDQVVSMRRTEIAGALR